MDNSDMHASTKAMMNPLLLNLIFSYMDAPTLKSARSVCTLWADLAASFLGEQVSVTFTKGCHCRRKTSKSSKELASLHPKLAKSVVLKMTTPCSGSLPRNLTTNLPHVSHYVVELNVTMNSKFVPALEHMWKMHHFPNLLKLTITFIMIKVDNDDENDQDDEEADVVVVTPKIPQFLTLPNLKSLKIVVKDQTEIGQDDEISSICRRLLNSASNVQQVEIDASFNPDFTSCAKLKVLSYTFVQFFDGWVTLRPDEDYVSMRKLAGMLDTCRNSLTSLTLSSFYDARNLIPGTFMLPSIPNLKVLHIDELYRLGNFLHPVNLPNLTHVTFSNYYCLDYIVRNFETPHEQITSLDVGVLYSNFDVDVTAAAKIVRLFPSVKNFRLKLDISRDGNDLPNITEMLQSFATWDFTSASVEVDNDEVSPDVLGVLRGVAVWEDLSRTGVSFKVTASPTFVLDDSMEDILLACRTLKWIKMSGFRMEEEEKELFQEFMELHALPISWVD